MLTLMIWRHAKSAWDDPGLVDHDRPLSQRGAEAAPVMAQHMEQTRTLPRTIFCSTALRARQTLAALLPHLASDVAIRIERSFYEADSSGLIHAIRLYGGTAGPLMVIGHNPTMEDLAANLTGGDGDARMAMMTKFPTAALATIRFPIPQWSALEPAGSLENFVRPRDVGHILNTC